MTVERLITEIHIDYCNSDILPFSLKLQHLLEWVDDIAAIRASIVSICPEEGGTVPDYEAALLRLGEFVFSDVDTLELPHQMLTNDPGRG